MRWDWSDIDNHALHTERREHRVCSLAVGGADAVVGETPGTDPCANS